MKTFWIALVCLASSPVFARGLGVDASAPMPAATADDAAPTFMEELNPADPRTEEILQQYDQYYEQQTGLPSHLEGAPANDLFQQVGGCYQIDCALWADVDRSSQRLNLYEGGQLIATWATSTGLPGTPTPNFDRHPDGRIYQRYSSAAHPGGDYMGLGNMPYAVFIQGGYAIHGTPAGNWGHLGHAASHGCIRIHPDNAKIFNQLVRHYGVQNVWITVHQ